MQFQCSLDKERERENNEMEWDLCRRKAQRQRKEFQFYTHALTEVTDFEHLPTTTHTQIKKKEKQRKERWCFECYVIIDWEAVVNDAAT